MAFPAFFWTALSERQTNLQGEIMDSFIAAALLVIVIIVLIYDRFRHL